MVHTDAALKNGATREEISEALGVAITVNAGAALVHSARVLDAIAANQYWSGFSRAPPFLNFDLIAFEVRERKNLIKEG